LQSPGSEHKTEDKDIVLLVVKQGYERAEYWSGEGGDSRSVRVESDLFMVGSPISSASVSAVLSS
jgi:hypothetical protein